MGEAIPQLDEQSARGPSDPIGRFLFGWSWLSALGGSILLFAICAVSVISVLGRWLFNTPMLGDVELVQIGCSLAITAFLPYAQMKNAHVIVDIVTNGAPLRVRDALDRIAAAILALAAAIIAWRSGIGAYDAWRSGEENMILGWPLWVAYINIGPGFVLLCLTALYTVWKGAGRPEGGA
jgi:TRAP-type C4-dicarboxylate transport system permease small subunit